MAEKKIRINTVSLNQTKKNLQTKLDRVRKDMEKIQDDIGVLNSMWDGDAHDAFQQQAETDISFISGVCDSIQGIIQYEGNAVKEYDKCEQQVADLIERIRI